MDLCFTQLVDILQQAGVTLWSVAVLRFSQEVIDAPKHPGNVVCSRLGIPS